MTVPKLISLARTFETIGPVAFILVTSSCVPDQEHFCPRRSAELLVMKSGGELGPSSARGS